MGNLITPEKIRKLRQALYAKAKGEPEFRFYRLYDKVYREDILAHAFACCRSNKGAPGADGMTFEDVEAYGREKWLRKLASELRERTYKPGAIRRVFIPKPNGKQRPLGIPNLKDRVCQTAAMIVLEPIFEADLPPEQYAYRSGKNALEAVEEVRNLLNHGHVDVVDADLSGYFDTIPHAELMKSVARRIVDKHILRLIKMWLEAPVEEDDGDGGGKRTTRNKDERLGIPQGSPISPLLANLYMRRFIEGWKKFGYGKQFGAKIVNYADDLVICCWKGKAEMAMSAMRHTMTLLKLKVNEEKTRNTGGKFRLPWVHFRAFALLQKTEELHRQQAVQEERQANNRSNSHPDRKRQVLDGSREHGAENQSQTEGLGQLLQERHCRQNLRYD